MTQMIKEKPDKVFGNLEYFDTESVSKILDLNPVTIRDYFNKKILLGVKIGKNWYISRIDLELFLINGKLKKRDELTFEDYKILEKNYLARIENNLRKIKAQQEKIFLPQAVKEKLEERYIEIKNIYEDLKKNPMTIEDFNTHIELEEIQ